MQATLVAVLIFTIASNYLDVVHCDGDTTSAATAGSTNKQPAATVTRKSAAARGKPDTATTVKQTAQTKPSGKKPNPINPSRSPARGRSPNAPTPAKKSQPPQQDKRKSVKA
ncbi:unnamed protein product [Schistosoma turkestanicum]|nr:unnamed protein product [Schistosoma turkestanicum]